MGDRYAELALRHWRDYWPAAYASLDDPEEFFRRMGAEAQARVEELTKALIEEDPPTEADAASRDRVSQAKRSAEAAVLRNFLLPPPPDDEGVDDTALEDTADEVAEAVADFYQARNSLCDARCEVAAHDQQAAVSQAAGGREHVTERTSDG
jgi:hypothetical protein